MADLINVATDNRDKARLKLSVVELVAELNECAAILLALQVVAIRAFGEGNKIAADIQKRIDAIDKVTGGGS